MNASLPFAFLALLVCGTAPSIAQTDVRPAPGGKRILFVDHDDIRPEPGGKRLLFIDGDDLRPEPGGKRLLFIDGDDIRPAPGGVRIAFWDGQTLRRKPAGEILLFVDGDTIRPTMGGPRLLFLDGPKLSREQVTAVLYVLKPELFTLPAGEVAAKQQEMAKNAAAEDARLAADQFPGERQITVHGTSGPTKRTGSVSVTKQGDFYAVAFKTADNPPWQGIGIKYKTQGGDQELWAGVAPGGAVSLGVYEIKGGVLSGTWVPVNAANDKSVFGFENLAGSPQLGGVYKITAGKLPNGGAAYTGALNIDPLTGTLKGGKCYRIRWSTGTTALGFVAENKLAVAAGWGADYEILRLKLDQGSLVGDFLGKTGATGSYTLTK
jgi:hypothetical protein